MRINPEFDDIKSSSEQHVSGHAQKQKKRPSKKQRQQHILINTIVSILLAVSLFSTSVLGAVVYFTGDAKHGELSSDHDDLGISSNVHEMLQKGIVNIALFGLDTRSRVTDDHSKALTGRSDTIIILSLNTDDGTIKLTSILRDSWVKIDGGKKYSGYNKINAAYGYGGAQLAIKTINQNFGLNIKDYVSVSLFQLWKVIDYISKYAGKIRINITEAERIAHNGLANSEGFNVTPIEKAGEVELDGGQAMTYSRIRKIDSENIRVFRQQKILNLLFEKVKQMPVKQYPNLLKDVLQHVETSLDYEEILSFTPMLSNMSIKLETHSIPGNEVIAEGGIFSDTRGGWVWKYDLDVAKKYLYKWIYNIE